MDHLCPHCGNIFKGEDLGEKKQPLFRMYRLCPHCDTPLIVDRRTRRRQIVLLMVTIVLLINFFLPYSMAKITTSFGLIVILLSAFHDNIQFKFELEDN